MYRQESDRYRTEHLKQGCQMSGTAVLRIFVVVQTRTGRKSGTAPWENQKERNSGKQYLKTYIAISMHFDRMLDI